MSNFLPTKFKFTGLDNKPCSGLTNFCSSLICKKKKQEDQYQDFQISFRICTGIILSPLLILYLVLFAFQINLSLFKSFIIVAHLYESYCITIIISCSNAFSQIVYMCFSSLQQKQIVNKLLDRCLILYSEKCTSYRSTIVTLMKETLIWFIFIRICSILNILVNTIWHLIHELIGYQKKITSYFYNYFFLSRMTYSFII